METSERTVKRRRPELTLHDLSEKTPVSSSEMPTEDCEVNDYVDVERGQLKAYGIGEDDGQSDELNDSEVVLNSSSITDPAHMVSALVEYQNVKRKVRQWKSNASSAIKLGTPHAPKEMSPGDFEKLAEFKELMMCCIMSSHCPTQLDQSTKVIIASSIATGESD